MAGAVRRIGILEMAGADPLRLSLWDVFKQRLKELGWIEGENISLDFCWADGHEERLKAGAAQLTGSHVDVLVTTGTPAADLASRATSTLPIVMATGTAPANAPPNVAGVIDLPDGLSEKRFALLHQTLPGAACLAVLLDKANSSSPRAIDETRRAASSAGVVLREYWTEGPDQFDKAFIAVKADGVGGVVLGPGAMLFARRSMLGVLAAQHRLPTMAVRKEYVEAGALMSYGSPIRDNYRRAAAQVDKILRGAKPADLPAEAPTEYELVINHKVADVLSLTMPEALLRQAIVIG